MILKIKILKTQILPKLIFNKPISRQFNFTTKNSD